MCGVVQEVNAGVLGRELELVVAMSIRVWGLNEKKCLHDEVISQCCCLTSIGLRPGEVW